MKSFNECLVFNMSIAWPYIVVCILESKGYDVAILWPISGVLCVLLAILTTKLLVDRAEKRRQLIIDHKGPDVKLCINCKYLEYERCKAPESESVDLVSGDLSYLKADLMRRSEMLCGEKGKYYKWKA